MKQQTARRTWPAFTLLALSLSRLSGIGSWQNVKPKPRGGRGTKLFILTRETEKPTKHNAEHVVVSVLSVSRVRLRMQDEQFIEFKLFHFFRTIPDKTPS